MTKKHLMKISLISLICGLVSCAISYFFFHFVTDEGITLTWHPEAGKPFVADMLGTLCVLFLFAAAFCLIVAQVVYGGKKEQKATDNEDNGEEENVSVEQ